MEREANNELQTSENGTSLSRNDGHEQEIVPTPIGIKTVIVALLLGTAGQIAWGLENNWFNVFVYDEITRDPGPVAWMVAVSAVVATVTTLVMGSLSDRTRSRWGRRKPYIAFGYIIWGIVTAIFPTAALVHDVTVASVLVVILDAVMTFFGSTANDAAFNAWITDVTDETNRGKMQGYLAVAALVANVIALGAAGFIIEDFGYSFFFASTGIVVTTFGVIALFTIEEPQIPDEEPPSVNFFKEFTPEKIRENKTLYLLMTSTAILGIGAQVFYPYLLIFLENYLHLGKETISIAMGAIILLTAVWAIVFGSFSHKLNRRDFLIASALLYIPMAIMFPYLLDTLAVVMVIFAIMQFVWIGAAILQGAWMQDLYPPEDRGKYQGIRLIFWVAIPMVVGPPIGDALIRRYGIYGEIDGRPGYIPTPEIFVVGFLISTLAVIPLLFIKREEGVVRKRNGKVTGVEF